jgi:ribosomal protein L11 methyltransferase
LLAIDNEEWAYNNCVENIFTNNCARITCVHGDDSYSFTEKFDIILANINRHVILNNLKNWKPLLNTGGTLIVSGILQNDESIVVSEAEQAGLQKQRMVENNGWLAITFQLPQ